MKNYNMAINFETTDSNKDSISDFLCGLGFKKIGHIKQDCCGFCIRTDIKNFWECSNFLNPKINILFFKDELKQFLTQAQTGEKKEG